MRSTTAGTSGFPNTAPTSTVPPLALRWSLPVPTCTRSPASLTVVGLPCSRFCSATPTSARGRGRAVRLSSGKSPLPCPFNGLRALAMEPYEKPVPRGSTIVLAREERWHDLKKKRHTLWIWKALDRETGQRLDWECGRRQKATLKKMKKLGLQNSQPVTRKINSLHLTKSSNSPHRQNRR